MSEPLQFDVVGAQVPSQYFGALTKSTLAHAYLFSGPPGVGKKTFARRLAQSLLCETSKEAVLGYDGTCRSCAMFAARGEARHPDFVEYEGALKIGEPGAPRGFHDSDDLTSRDVVRLFSMQSYAGGMRVLLLGDVEFASSPAANALLKFLEEAPAGVVTILTTSAPGRLLPTILSRLVDVHFPALTGDEVAALLGRLGYGGADVRRGAALAGGSVSRAVAVLESDDQSLRGGVAQWFFDSVAGQTPERTWATRETLDDGLETVKTLVRDWIVGRAAANAAPLAPDYRERIGTLPALAPERAVELLGKLEEAALLARTNVPAGMVAEFVRMALAAAPGRDLTKTA